MTAESRMKLTNIIKKLPEKTVDSLYETACKMFESYLVGEKPYCPFCKGKAVVRNGHKCGKQEYLCKGKDCRKTFVSTTNTLMTNFHQPHEFWEAVIDDTLSGDAIDFTTKRFRETLINELFNTPSILQGTFYSDIGINTLQNPSYVPIFLWESPKMGALMPCKNPGFGQPWHT